MKFRSALLLSSFAENPGLSSPGMNAPVAVAATAAPKGFLLRRIPPIDEWRLWALARRASFICGLWTVICGLSANADTIIANDGREIKGIMVEEYQDRVVFSTTDGEMSIMKSDIRELYFDSEEDNLIKLAERAREQKDYSRSYSYYQRALKISPDSKAAKDGLVSLQLYMFRKEELKKEDDLKKREALERYGASIAGRLSEAEEYEKSMKELKESSGMTLATKGNFPQIESVSINSPAYEAGARQGDLLVAIWGRLTGYMSLDEVLDVLLNGSAMEIRCTIERILDVSTGGNNIGASFKIEFDGLTISAVKEESPSYGAGLREGDLVTAIDGNNTRYLPLKKALDLIKGSKGGSVKITFRRNLIIWRKGRYEI